MILLFAEMQSEFIILEIQQNDILFEKLRYIKELHNGMFNNGT